MLVVQEFDTQVKVHMPDYTDHTCMDYSPLALASGNTLGNRGKLGKVVPVPVKMHCLLKVHWLLEQGLEQQQELQLFQRVLMQKRNCLLQKSLVVVAVLVAVV